MRKVGETAGRTPRKRATAAALALGLAASALLLVSAPGASGGTEETARSSTVRQTLYAPRTQRASSLYALVAVHVRDSRLTVSATVRAGGRTFRSARVSRRPPIHIPQRAKLRLSRTALSAVRRARGRARATIVATATARGDRGTARRTVRLRG
jgi:hypothetical protein